MDKTAAIYMFVGFVAGYAVCYWFTVVPLAEKIQKTIAEFRESHLTDRK